MINSETLQLEMKAYEAFIKRAALVDHPFMLKGSYVTRQYFSNPKDRIPADLDWVYMERIDDVKTAKRVFNNWAIKITELEVSDGVKFRGFKENQFWRLIDYAMAFDFPTVSTDLICWVDGVKTDFTLEISFNLNIEQEPIPLIYEPLVGESFIFPYTVPLSLQVSWKIHQTLVRPRFKDLFDLITLVKHPDFDQKTLGFAMEALLNECAVSQVDLNRHKHFLNYDFEKLFPKKSIQNNWNYWRHKGEAINYKIITYSEYAERITDVTKLPVELLEFTEQLKDALTNAGFNIKLISHLQIPEEIEEIEEDEVEEQKEEIKTVYSFVSSDILLEQEPEKLSLSQRLKHILRFWLG